MAILSIDLALTSYRDVGAALVAVGADAQLEARIVEVPLDGRPSALALADWIGVMTATHGVRGVAIDGPLGWRAPDTDSPHARLAERAVRAPGKTGLPPDGVKPRNYLAFTQLSIQLFEILTSERDWSLPLDARASDAANRFVTEVFPTAAWRALALPPLPGKSRSTPADVAAWRTRLETALPLTIQGATTHDQLQAVVGGIAPAWWLAGETSRVTLAGVPPVRLAGSWREGFIMVPASRAM